MHQSITEGAIMKFSSTTSVVKTFKRMGVSLYRLSEILGRVLEAAEVRFKSRLAKLDILEKIGVMSDNTCLKSLQYATKLASKTRNESRRVEIDVTSRPIPNHQIFFS